MKLASPFDPSVLAEQRMLTGDQLEWRNDPSYDWAKETKLRRAGLWTASDEERCYGGKVFQVGAAGYMNSIAATDDIDTRWYFYPAPVCFPGRVYRMNFETGILFGRNGDGPFTKVAQGARNAVDAGRA
jgi:hypothetical protein